MAKRQVRMRAKGEDRDPPNELSTLPARQAERLNPQKHPATFLQFRQLKGIEFLTTKLRNVHPTTIPTGPPRRRGGPKGRFAGWCASLRAAQKTYVLHMRSPVGEW